MVDHIYFLLTSKDAEILIVPENKLKDIYSLKNIVAVNENFDNEKCYFDGKCYAIPLDKKKLTSYGGTLISSQNEVYGILLNGDHKKQAEAFLLSLDPAE